MPPSNSPDPETPPSFISALRGLESPVNDDVLNLAATLGRQTDEQGTAEDPEATYRSLESFAALGAEDETERAHLHYLRAAQEHDLARLDRSRERLRLLERQRDELEQRDRLRRVMSRLSRLSDNTSSAYGDRVPSQNSLYDWSPANEGGAGESSLRSTAILQSAGVRRHPRFSARTRETLAASRTSRESPERDRSSSESTRQTSMQRLTEGRTSLDRERRDWFSNRGDSFRRSYIDRMSSNSSPTASPLLEHTVKYLSRIRHSNTIDESVNCALEAGFLSKDYFSMQYADFLADTFTIPPPPETSWLAPGAVLSGCQHATSLASNGTGTGSRSNPSLHQFRILDGSTSLAGPTRHPGLPPPIRPWIWAANEASPNRASQVHEAQSAQQDKWPVKVTIHDVDWEKMSLSATMEAYNVPSHSHSHSILSTSESPSPPATRTSSITTYLEGEILDFNTHTLLTESFKSNAANDATYWRKLPPFKQMSDDEVVRALTSRKWLTEVLGQEWILMRWKERCFVKSLNRSTADPVPPIPTTSTSTIPDTLSPNPWSSNPMHASQLQPSPYRIVRNPSTGRAEVEITPTLPHPVNDAEHATFDDSGCGLTISGFYYVALERRTGALEGLYYDPQSSPYQCLRLESVRGGLRSAWQFR